MKKTFLAGVLLTTAMCSLAFAQAALDNNPALQQIDKNVTQVNPSNFILATPDPNPAMNDPDMVSWQLFVQVNAPAATQGNNNALFETWASNDDTFKQNPVFPSTAVASVKSLKVPALVALAPRKPGLQPHVIPALPGQTESEEVRRNKAAFDFIVSRKLYTRAGLKAAFTAGNAIVFPTDAIEVKANWKLVTPGLDTSLYHVNTASDGKQYALVSMHVISKQVPNWTWATFEHKDNPGRCDIIGCRDSFGATGKVVAPKMPAGGQYPACVKTASLKKMFTDGKLPAEYDNYCLKGSQVDFTTSSGLITLLGNSVTENGFVDTSSCMTCHSRGAVDSNGANLYGGGFVSNGSPNGPPLASWFWNNPNKPNQTRKALQMDFVWSISRLAIP